MESLRSLRGFTLIELLVVLAIIGVVSVVVVTSQSSFNKKLTLANTAYDVALTLRSAETYGLSSRATAGGISNTGYGISFSTGNPASFTLFADTMPAGVSGTVNCAPIDSGTPNCRPGDNVYTSGSDVLVQTYALGNGATIQDFCALSSGAWTCASNGLTSLDIVFARPNPDPFISKNGSYSSLFPVTQACITLAAQSAQSGPYRYISVAQSGEITAKAASCP